MALKKITWYAMPQTINDNFEEIEANMIEGAAPITLLPTSNLPAVPASFSDVAAVRTYLLTLVDALETINDGAEGKTNTLITNLRASGAIKIQ